MDELVSALISRDTALFKTKDGLAKYRISHLRALYVISQDTPDEFCDRFNLALTAFARVINEGRWNELRSKYARGETTILLQATQDRLQALYESEIEQLEILSFQERQQIDELYRHRARWGDLFLHDQETGKVVKDIYGIALPVPLVSSPGRLKMKLASCELLEGLTRVLKGIQDAAAARQPVVSNPGTVPALVSEQEAIDAEIFGKKGD